jgi:hypothetical protein
MIAGLVLTNLFYVVGAIAAATVVSAIVLLRHRRPRSLESGIEMFSRELKALRPEHSPTAPPGADEGAADDGAAGAYRLRSRAYGKGARGPAAHDRPGATGGSGTSGTGRSSSPRSDAPRTVTRLAPESSRDSTRPGYTIPGRDGAGTLSPDQENEPG